MLAEHCCEEAMKILLIAFSRGSSQVRIAHDPIE
jgi:hypothetical protein